MEANKQLVKKKMGTVKDLLTRFRPQLESALPKHVTIDRLMGAALAAVNKQPLLLECRPESLLRALYQCAQLGLEPDTPLGLAYLVPYGKQVQFIPGYRGLISLARRSGNITGIESRIVYEKDRFEVCFGLKPELIHFPAYDEADRGKIRLVYSIARFRRGEEPQVEIMNKPQIDGIMKRSAAGDRGPWGTDYEEMARKTVVKRLCKYLPLSIDLAQAIELDNQAETGKNQEIMAEVDLTDVADVAKEEKPVKTETASSKLAMELDEEPPLDEG